MIPREFLRRSAWLGCFLGLAGFARADEVSFRRDVAPILVGRCLGCHTREKPQGGLVLETFAAMKAGGDVEGEGILEPGDPDASHLVRVLKVDAKVRMPLKQDPLTDAQISTLERWVKEGAKFDGESEAGTSIASMVDPLSLAPAVALTASVSDPVASLAFSSDGKWLAAGKGADVLVFDVAASKVAYTLPGHPGDVDFVGFTTDGGTILAAGGRPGMSGFITSWDVDSKAKKAEVPKAHADTILGAALSPDGKTLATVSYDRLVKLWDAATLDARSTLKEHTDAVYAVAFDASGDRLATVSGDRTAKVWETSSGKRLASLGDATGELYTVAFGPDGSSLFAGGADRKVWKWRLEGQAARLEASPNAHDAAVLHLLVSADGARLYSAGEDRKLSAWTLPGLEPAASLPDQPDWPQALAIDPDSGRLAVGRQDGTLALFATAGGEPTTLIGAPAPPPPPPAAAQDKKPELLREATLNPPSPRAATAGQKVTMSLSGLHAGEATAVVFDDASFTTRILDDGERKADSLRAEVDIPATAPAGPRRFWITTPSGVPAAQIFYIDAAAETGEQEPNDAIDRATAGAVPSTLSGAINVPGDVDCWRLDLKAGQQVVVQDRAKALGSILDPLYEALDGQGKVIASGRSTLAFSATADGPHYLRLSDLQFGGSGGHIYRLEVSQAPYVATAFPLGVTIGGESKVEVTGVNLPGSTVVATAAAALPPGAILPVPGTTAGAPRLVAAAGPQGVEGESTPLPCPSGVSGRIQAPGEADLHPFQALKRQRMVVEVFGRRVGSPVDPVVEILDAQGKPLPRALLRPVAETNVAFRDHNSTQKTIRLTKWDDLAMDDYLLVGRDLMRIQALPKNPDDDAVFWGAGQRRGYLGTTPEQHSLGQPMRKVEILPPGSDGGASAVTIDWVNDDAGPGFQKDPYLIFEPPADGVYMARVTDARGLGGPDFVYHLVLREPRPDFDLGVGAENVNIPRGMTTLVTVNINRRDGFEEAVDVRVEGLPAGISAMPARIEAGHDTAELAFTASAEAAGSSEPTWKVVAESGGLRHEVEPAGPKAGWITVTPKPDLEIVAEPTRIEVRPGQEVHLTLRVQRSAAFAGRVPIDVKNLPHGVRVLNIGLNGVLVTEKQTERDVTIYAEPWVQPMERPIYAVGRVEATGALSGAPPITLVVLPSGTEGVAVRP